MAVCQFFAVLIIIAPFRLQKTAQLLQLGQSQCGLQICHTVIISVFLMDKIQRIIFRLLGQVADMLYRGGIAGNHHSAAASCDNLIPIEGKHPRVPHGSGVKAGVPAFGKDAAHRLRGILNHIEVVRLRQIHQAVHVAVIAEHMDGKHGLYRFPG